MMETLINKFQIRIKKLSSIIVSGLQKLIPGWYDLRLIKGFIGIKSMYIPIVLPLLISFFSDFLKETNQGISASFLIILSILCFVIYGRIVEIFYPDNLTTTNSDFLNAANENSSNLLSTLENFNKINNIWREEIDKHVSDLDATEETKSGLKKELNFRAITPYTNEFIELIYDSCSPISQQQLNYGNPWARFFASIFLLTSIISIIVSLFSSFDNFITHLSEIISNINTAV